MFTCSAGDSQFGLSKDLHICHDTFYTTLPGYDEAVLEDTDRLHNESKLVKSGKVDMTRQKLVHDLDSDELTLIRHIYVLRAFHDYAHHKIGFAVSLIKLMSEADQISPVYKDDEWAALLAIYCLSRHSCPAQNYLYFGSTHINHPGYYKLFGNGALEEFVKMLFNEK